MIVFPCLFRRLSSLALLLFLGLAVGCGDHGSTGTLSGKVTYKGTPVTGGSILFVSSQGVTRGEIQADGTYRVAGVPVGAAKIAIEPLPQVAPEIRKRMEQSWGGKQRPASAASPGTSGGTPVSIPPRYKDAETSGLNCTVQGGNQTCDFPLD